jgi:hypothetical protein
MVVYSEARCAKRVWRLRMELDGSRSCVWGCARAGCVLEGEEHMSPMDRFVHVCASNQPKARLELLISPCISTISTLYPLFGHVAEIHAVTHR